MPEKKKKELPQIAEESDGDGAETRKESKTGKPLPDLSGIGKKSKDKDEPKGPPKFELTKFQKKVLDPKLKEGRKLSTMDNFISQIQKRFDDINVNPNDKDSDENESSSSEDEDSDGN